MFKKERDQQPMPGIFKTICLMVFLIIVEQLFPVFQLIGSQIDFSSMGVVSVLVATPLLIRWLSSYPQATSIELPSKSGKIIFKAWAVTFLLTIFWSLLMQTIIAIFKITDATNVSQNQENLNSYMNSPVSFIFVALLAIIIGPIIEEMVFRYLIMRPTPAQRKWVRWVLNSLSVSLFTLAHLAEQLFNTSLFNLINISGSYFILAGVLTYVYAKYRNLWLNIAIHASWNVLALTISLLGLIAK